MRNRRGPALANFECMPCPDFRNLRPKTTTGMRQMGNTNSVNTLKSGARATRAMTTVIMLIGSRMITPKQSLTVLFTDIAPSNRCMRSPVLAQL